MFSYCLVVKFGTTMICGKRLYIVRPFPQPLQNFAYDALLAPQLQLQTSARSTTTASSLFIDMYLCGLLVASLLGVIGALPAVISLTLQPVQQKQFIKVLFVQQCV